MSRAGKMVGSTFTQHTGETSCDERMKPPNIAVNELPAADPQDNFGATTSTPWQSGASNVMS
jgi:hypothetical protein